MSTRASSAKTFATSSLQGSSQDEDTRWRSRGGSGSLNVESSHHSYPKTPGMMPAAYGQTQDLRPFNRSNYSDVNFVPSQPQTHALPGGPSQTSPFVGFAPAAPGFPIQQQFQQTPPINPLQYNASCPYPAPTVQATPMPQAAYTTSGSAYLPYNYNQRPQTTGTMYPPGQQGAMLHPSTSYTVPFGAPPVHSKSNEYSDDCFNIFWLFFLLGPLTWPCAMFGVCSEKHSERMAGFISAVCLVLVVIAAIVIITQAPGDSE